MGIALLELFAGERVSKEGHKRCPVVAGLQTPRLKWKLRREAEAVFPLLNEVVASGLP